MRHTARSKPELVRLLELLSPTDRRVMAQLWAAPSHDAAALAAIMLDPARVTDQIAQLSEAERGALTHILGDGGAVPVAVLQREWGAVREPGKFEHPRAYLQALQTPASPTERLYSMGLIFRAHDERGAIYRVPNDLLPLLPVVAPRDRRLHVEAADAPADLLPNALDHTERAVVALLICAYNGDLKTVDDGALSKASLTKLIQQIDGAPEPRTLRREADWPLIAWLRTAAVEAGLLRRTGDNELRPTAHALDWLRAPQAQRAQRVLNGWCASVLDDLTLLCGLRWKGGAPYTLNRTATRRGLLRLLGTLPPDTWVQHAAIVAEVHRVDPDFQRRDGRYDTWLLYNDRDELVSSWADWDRVEGALIRAVLIGPLFWLGLVHLDTAHELARLTPLGAWCLADGAAPPDPPSAPLIVQSTFEVVCPPNASLYARFQLSRIAELQHTGTVTRFKLTRRAILAAADRGITAQDAHRFLQEHAAGTLPPAVAYTLLEWGGQTDQIQITNAVLLETADPIMLAQVRNTRGLDLEDTVSLSPTLLRLPDGLADEIAERLRRAGFGVRDERIDPQTPFSDRDLLALVTAACVYARICAELGLPTEVTPAMLQRIKKLVPPRNVAAAEQAADHLAKQIAGASMPPPDRDQAD